MAPAARAAAIPSWTAAHADLVDGSVLHDVTVTWTDDGMHIRLARSNGAWKDIAPSQLVRAVDADGRDLRDEIMAARPAGARGGGGSAPPGGYGEVGVAPGPVRRTNLADDDATVFRSVVSLSPGWGAGGGDWAFGLHSGFSLQATARFGINRWSWMSLAARRQDAGGDDAGTDRTSLSVREYSIMVGGSFVPIRGPRAMVTWDLGLSAVQKRRSFESMTGDIVTYSSTHSDVRPMIVAQLGALVPLGEHCVLDVQARAGTTPPFMGDEEPGGSVYAVQAGIGWVRW